MGVGEDESLGDSISITIIATGFNMDQQDIITESETRKIVHVLKEEKVVRKNEKPIEVAPKKQEEEKRFVLEEETKEPNKAEIVPDINEIKVVYEDVNSIDEEDFIITDITPVEETSDFVDNEDEDQFSFTFDLPLPKERSITEISDKPTDIININDIEIIGLEEIKPERVVEGDLRHNLEEEFAPELNTLKSISDYEKDKDESLNFELKTEERKIVKKKESKKTEKNTDDISPMNLTIAELRNKAEDRRQKMKEFNYKFINNMNQSVDDSSNQPAYKRMGVSLTDISPSSETDNDQSRMTLGTDDDDNIQFRSNNSFLHDNVD